MIDNLLIYALIFKPKKLKDPWEHKKGFRVMYDLKVALTIVENRRSLFSQLHASEPNYHQSSDYETLRKIAEKRLYEIQSSANNYIEIICCIGGVFIGLYAFSLLEIIWNYPSRGSVRLFVALIASIILLIFVYKKKKSIDSYLVKDFLNIEDAIYKFDYGESQYQIRRK